jgi:F0F1-type ATP synthase delta subunit
MKDNYIKAATELIEAGTPVETVLGNIKQVMNRKGHSALYVSVLRGLVQALELDQSSSMPKVVVADANSAALEKVRAGLATLGSDAKEYNTVVDPTIVGGLIVSHNHKMLDQSYKTKLRNLYQSIVS